MGLPATIAALSAFRDNKSTGGQFAGLVHHGVKCLAYAATAREKSQSILPDVLGSTECSIRVTANECLVSRTRNRSSLNN